MPDQRNGWMPNALVTAAANVFFAPARAMNAMPPSVNALAPGNGGLLGNWLLKAHEAIDPVRAMGGYGNLAAMALPPGGPVRVPKSIRAYHGTTNGEIAAFDPHHFSNSGGGELGPHFGSRQQANYRVRGAGREGASVFPVNIEVKKFLRMSDRASWDPLGGNFIEDLKDAARLNYDEVAPLYEMRNASEDLVTASKGYKDANKQARDYIRDLLTRKGYDAVGYKNKWEGPGDSIIPLKRGSVKNALTGETMFGAAATGGLGALLYRALNKDSGS